jgi:hypothetical protein
MVPKQGVAGNRQTAPIWVGGLFTFRVVRVGPFEKLGKVPVGPNVGFEPKMGEDQFQEEENTLWQSAWLGQ